MKKLVRSWNRNIFKIEMGILAVIWAICLFIIIGIIY